MSLSDRIKLFQEQQAKKEQEEQEAEDAELGNFNGLGLFGRKDLIQVEEEEPGSFPLKKRWVV
jgi:hypothetical protein